MLVHKALKDIPDVEVLGNLSKFRKQIDDLIGSVNLALMKKGDSTELSFMSTGLELKDAISLLDDEDQIKLLLEWRNSTKDDREDRSYVSEKERDDTRFKRGLIRSGLRLLTILVGFFGGAVMIETWVTGKVPVEAMSSLMNGAMDFFKIFIP